MPARVALPMMARGGLHTAGLVGPAMRVRVGRVMRGRVGLRTPVPVDRGIAGQVVPQVTAQAVLRTPGRVVLAMPGRAAPAFLALGARGETAPLSAISLLAMSCGAPSGFNPT